MSTEQNFIIELEVFNLHQLKIEEEKQITIVHAKNKGI